MNAKIDRAPDRENGGTRRHVRYVASLLPLVLVAAYFSMGQSSCEPNYTRPYAAGWGHHVRAARIKVISAQGSSGDRPYLAVINFQSTFGSSNSTSVEFVDHLDILPTTPPGQSAVVTVGNYPAQGVRVVSTAGNPDASVPIVGQFVLAMESDDVGWDPVGGGGVRDRMYGVRACLEEQLDIHVANGQWGEQGISGLLAIGDVAAAVRSKADEGPCEVPTEAAAPATITQKALDRDDRIGTAVTLLLGISESDYESLQNLAASPWVDNEIACETPLAQAVGPGQPSLYFSICPFGNRTLTFPFIGANAHWELTTTHRPTQTPSGIWFAQPRWTLAVENAWSLVPWTPSMGPYRPEVTLGEGGVYVNEVSDGTEVRFPGLSEAESMAWYASPRYGLLGPNQKILAASNDTIKVNHFNGEYDPVFGTARSWEPYAWAPYEDLQDSYEAPAGNNPTGGSVYVQNSNQPGSYIVYFNGVSIQNVMVHSQTPGIDCKLAGPGSLDDGVVPVSCNGGAKFYVQGIMGFHFPLETYAYFDNPTAATQTANPGFSKDPFAALPTAGRIGGGLYAVMRDDLSLKPRRSTPLVTAVGSGSASCYVLYIDNVFCHPDDGSRCFVVDCGGIDTAFMVRWIMSENALP